MQSARLASCSVRVFWPFFAYFRERRGHAASAAQPLPYDNGEERVPHERAMALLADAMRESGDPVLGLHVAEVASHGAFDALDYVTRTSRTLLEAFERASVYITHWIHDGLRFAAEPEDDAYVLRLRFADGLAAPAQAIEFTLASLLLRFRPLLRASDLWRVRFVHGPPDDLSEHERILGAPVSFLAPDNALILSRECALRELPSWQAEASVRGQASHCLPALREASFGERVRAMVAEDLHAGLPCIERICERLHMSPRTVQRRLSDEGTNFKALADDVRRSLAEAYVRERKLSLSEVSFRLGFASVNAFHRAFRRWTGQTPALYRQTGVSR